MTHPFTTETDPGIRIWHLARALTNPELWELLAIHQLDLWTPDSVRMPFAEHSEIVPPLVERGLLKWRQTSKTRRYGMLTELGQRVLIARIEYDLKPEESGE